MMATSITRITQGTAHDFTGGKVPIKLIIMITTTGAVKNFTVSILIRDWLSITSIMNCLVMIRTPFKTARRLYLLCTLRKRMIPLDTQLFELLCDQQGYSGIRDFTGYEHVWNIYLGHLLLSRVSDITTKLKEHLVRICQFYIAYILIQGN